MSFVERVDRRLYTLGLDLLVDDGLGEPQREGVFDGAYRGFSKVFQV